MSIADLVLELVTLIVRLVGQDQAHAVVDQAAINIGMATVKTLEDAKFGPEAPK